MKSLFSKLRSLACVLYILPMTSAHALEDARKSNEASLRIISLSPHLTELVYALESQEQLVAVSDYSDYPEQASQLPSVASFQGLDFETIVRLQPSIILAWQGGNKPQDLARLTSLGFKVFYSHPKSLSDISADIRSLGKVLSRVKLSEQLANNFDKRVKVIRQQYEMKSKVPVLYYLWPKPLMTIGPSAWGNELLNLCGARGIFDDAINDYPEVPIESVIKRKPNVIIAVNKESRQQIVNFWEPWLPLLERKKHHIIQANPDLLHRFTPRLLDGLSSLCEQIDISTRNNK